MTYHNVFEAISNTPEQAANLTMRAELMQILQSMVSTRGWTQMEAAAHLGVTQPRVNDLMRGKFSKFSLDALVNMAAALHARVHVRIEEAADDLSIATDRGREVTHA
jgi:predicted XRE-type DNA-binding protein